MPKFISNYVILTDGKVLHNHIVITDDSGRMKEIVPFDTELAYTRFVPNPIMICNHAEAEVVKTTFDCCKSLNEFCDAIALKHYPAMQKGMPMSVLELDFEHRVINKLQG